MDMSNKCVDPEIGAMLHAYELNALEEKESERFEKHLLECPSCFEKVQELAPDGHIMLRDKKLLKRASKTTISGKLTKYLWPDIPLLLRPAVTLALIALLVYPAYLGLKSLESSGITTAQNINLFPSRSVESPVINISGDNPVIITFMHREAVPGNKYTISLFKENIAPPVYTIQFDQFDRFETGRLLVPAGKLPAGDYRLEIIESDSSDGGMPTIYTFKVIDG